MNIAKGTVERITTREFEGKYGPSTAYSLKLSDGNFYSVGFKKPSFNEGSQVEFVYTVKEVGDKEFYNARLENVEVTGQAENTPTVSTNSTPMAATKGNKDDYWTARAIKDEEISRRLDIVGSRNSAIAFVLGAVDAGALKLPAKADKSFDALLAAVNNVMDGFLLHPENIKELTQDTEEVVTEEDFD